jgi:selenocysteine lyase/cysteine desulfurase
MEVLIENSLLEAYFTPYRKRIIGNDIAFETPYGVQKIIYADWTASGRLYAPIEQRLSNEIGALVANTHTETSHTGTLMTHAYHKRCIVDGRFRNDGCHQ